jgi:2-polyprenyl-6-hydroxyphenyl methylase/3-demethylubiquinone-9 3-methyltransferase
MQKTTVNNAEIDKFAKISEQWWDINGKFRPLHVLNPTRLKYIRQSIIDHFGSSEFQKLSLLDVGCGGGLVSEPLANIGFNVTGIDAGAENIEIAKHHAKLNNIDVKYKATSVEELRDKKDKFDVVLALEIIEHVDNVEYFIECISGLLKKNGIIIFSTLNKTIKSYIMAIIGAEYVLRMLPVGTHDFNKFIKPSQLVPMAELNGLVVKDLKGMVYNPIQNSWKLSSDIDVNYFACFGKLD